MPKENHIVEKSTPLIYAEWSKFNSNELKIFELYLSRINARDPSSSRVKFTKAEWCKIYGVPMSAYKNAEIQDKVSRFLSNRIKITFDDNKGKKGYKEYNLFSDATCYFDEKDQTSYIEIECNPNLKPAFFELVNRDKDGNIIATNYRYIKYRLINTMKLDQKHSIKLYSVLKDKSYTKDKNVVANKVKIDLNDLKRWLGVDKVKSYDKFKEFNRSVLKKSQDEINENSDIKFTYEPVKNGRSIESVEFTIVKQKLKGQEDESVVDVDAKESELKTDEDSLFENMPEENLDDYGYSVDDVETPSKPDKINKKDKKILDHNWRETETDSFLLNNAREVDRARIFDEEVFDNALSIYEVMEIIELANPIFVAINMRDMSTRPGAYAERENEKKNYLRLKYIEAVRKSTLPNGRLGYMKKLIEADIAKAKEEEYE